MFFFFLIESIQEERSDRMTDEAHLENAANVDKLVYKENVFGKNLSPSLQHK